MRFILLAVTLLTLAACAGGMSKEECLYADWRAVGYEDGAAGLDASAIGSRRVACADKAKVTPDMTAYLAGREEGLNQFCRPASGFDYGARGHRYAGACSGRDEDRFVAAYETGLMLYGLLQNVDAARRALANAHAEIDSLDLRITNAEAALISPTTPHAERVEILVDLKGMHQRRDKVRDAVDDLAFDVDRAEAALEDFRRENDSRDYAQGALRAMSASY
jgi:hypothetical protein